LGVRPREWGCPQQNWGGGPLVVKGESPTWFGCCPPRQPRVCGFLKGYGGQQNINGGGRRGRLKEHNKRPSITEAQLALKKGGSHINARRGGEL